MVDQKAKTRVLVTTATKKAPMKDPSKAILMALLTVDWKLKPPPRELKKEPWKAIRMVL